MKEVSLIAATFYGNRGAEAMLASTIGNLRDELEGEDLRFNVFTYYPKDDSSLTIDKNIFCYSSTPKYLVAVLCPMALLYSLLSALRVNFMLRFFPSSVRALARSKVLICLAGVSFVGGRDKFLPFNIATILPAMLLGVPVVKIAQAMGPFESKLSKWSAKIFLGRCEKVFTRGNQTHSYLQTLLPHEKNYCRADDIAFLFKPSHSLSSPDKYFDTCYAKALKEKENGEILVGICPSVVIAKQAEVAGWDYVGRMTELVEKIIEEGYKVVIYPNATRANDMDKSHNNDLPLLNEIFSNINNDYKKSTLLFNGSLNAAQIHNIVKLCDVHSVSRFHAMVGALALGVPVMVIGWSHKYLEVMANFSQEDMVLDYKNGEVKPIVDRINILVNEAGARRSQITKALPEVKKRSKVQVDLLASIIKVN